MKQARFIVASAIEKDAKMGFGGDYEEDIRRSVIGAGALPAPPYTEQSDLIPHVRTGDLRGAIRKEPDGEDYWVKAGGDAAPYAAYVEYGTIRARPHPFMFPAVEMNRGRWNELVRKALRHKAESKKGRRK
jgi:HK97 gp10 family phage protein